MRKKYRYPRSMKEAKSVLASICHSKEWNIEVYFDDKFGNFSNVTENQAFYSSGEYIECSVFKSSMYDLLIAAVFHELGHKMAFCEKDGAKQGIWANEFEAWANAMRLHRKYFSRNFSVNQARYAMECLLTYMPSTASAPNKDSKENKDNKESEDSVNKDRVERVVSKEMLADFWCPIQKKILK